MSDTVSAYPFLQPGASEASETCNCKYSYSSRVGYMKVQMADVIRHGRFKHGFVEFGTPSSPPKKFLTRRYDFSYYNIGEDTVTAWAEQTINPSTGVDTTTYSSPPPSDVLPLHVWILDELVSQTPTQEIYVYEILGGGGEVISRVEMLVTLNSEHTTEQLKNDTLDELPDWLLPDDFIEDSVRWPGAYDPISESGGFATPDGVYSLPNLPYPDGYSCYPGDPERFYVRGRSAFNIWFLSNDEVVFFIQRCKYKLRCPHAKHPITYSLQWDERFYSEAGAWSSPHHTVTESVSTPTTVTGTYEIEEVEANGVVMVGGAKIL